MKIAFLMRAGRFPSGILQELRAQLPQHQLIHWTRGESSPATDIDVLLVLGEVTAAEMASQTKLALIQTVSAGYEGIDIDAANDLGIWVSFSPSGGDGQCSVGRRIRGAPHARSVEASHPSCPFARRFCRPTRDQSRNERQNRMHRW